MYEYGCNENLRKSVSLVGQFSDRSLMMVPVTVEPYKVNVTELNVIVPNRVTWLTGSAKMHPGVIGTLTFNAYDLGRESLIGNFEYVWSLFSLPFITFFSFPE